MQLVLAAALLLSLAAMASASCYSCYSSPCWYCSSGDNSGYNTPSYSCNTCNTYTPYYQPSYYRGGNYGSSAASAAASSSSGYGGSSSAAAAASSSGWGSSSAAASASSGFSSYFQPSVYYDVSPDQAATVDTEEKACEVLVEQWADRPISPQEMVHYIQETFFGKNAKRNFTKDATPSTFQCCHAKFSHTAFKAGRALAPVETVKGLKVKLDYTVPVLPKGTTCDTLTAQLLKGLKGDAAAGKNNSKAVEKKTRRVHL